MKINILTLFPEMFDIFNHSIIGKAQDKGIIDIEAVNIRDYTNNKHKKVDDYPYGGGAGMVMQAQPVVDAIRACKKENKGKVIFLGPKGKTMNQALAKELSTEENLIFLCGHYEGIDERAFKEVDMQISLGDFVLTGGEMAAIPVIDSIVRLVPGVLNKSESHEDESFSDGLLDILNILGQKFLKEKGYQKYYFRSSWKYKEMEKATISFNYQGEKTWSLWKSGADKRG